MLILQECSGPRSVSDCFVVVVFYCGNAIKKKVLYKNTVLGGGGVGGECLCSYVHVHDVKMGLNAGAKVPKLLD